MAVQLTPNGTFGAPRPNIPKGLMKPGMALVSAVMRLFGLRVVRLTTIGARSGQRRTTDLLAVVPGPDTWLITGSSAGAARHPDWCFNMAAHPDQVWLRDGSREMRVEVTSLEGDERTAAYAMLIAKWKGYAGYVGKTDRVIPVFRLTASK